MFLGDLAIKEAIQKKDIVIDPFQESCLQTNSYDLHLGSYYIRMKDYPYVLRLDSNNDQLLHKLFGNVISVGTDGLIILSPGEFILAQTQEYFGTERKYAALLRCRSTFARLGIDVCSSAGLGDVGFVSHWTLEIVNHSHNQIALESGMRIAQACFIEVKGLSKGRKYNGSYLDNRHAAKGLPAFTQEDMPFLHQATMYPDLRREKLI